MKIIYLFILLITAYSCATEKDMTSNTESTTSSSASQNKNIKATLGEKGIVSNPIQITGVSISANIMTIDVSYSGGCGEHSFELIGSPMIAKSMPPIRTIHLIHTSKNDNCKKLVIDQIKVDIADLAYKKEKGSEIYLALEGWSEKIKYTVE